MQIRKTRISELKTLEGIYARARQRMREEGNPEQWKDNYPSKEVLIEDIENGNSYVCFENGKIVGTFYFAKGIEDPTYKVIEQGQWIKEGPYGVIHRIAIDVPHMGYGSRVFRWCFTQIPNLRIDTYKDNRTMQQALKRNEFIYCGIIHIKDGSERMAYQKIE